MGDKAIPQHFSIEQGPESEQELVERNAYLAKLGITAIWFEKGCFDYVESILRLAKNELRYRGVIPGTRTRTTMDKGVVVSKRTGLFGKIMESLFRINWF